MTIIANMEIANIVTIFRIAASIAAGKIFVHALPPRAIGFKLANAFLFHLTHLRICQAERWGRYHCVNFFISRPVSRRNNLECTAFHASPDGNHAGVALDDRLNIAYNAHGFEFLLIYRLLCGALFMPVERASAR
jgi:hypothetical protein